jgi:predicted anti-sigma-YlaC factor YlaD
VQLEADEVEGRDVQAAIELRHRARRLYLRGRDFGLRGLEVTHPGWSQRLRTDPPRAVAELVREDVPLLYWTACAWAGATAVLKNDADLIAELPLVGAMIDRALVLDEAFDQGALHTFLITWEMARPDATGDPAERARAHYRRALELTGGAQAGPHVAVAEAVAVAQQNRTEFEALLRQALAIDPGSQPEARLVNLVVQRRARHLLAHADALVEPATERDEGASARADGGKSDIKLTDTLQTQRRKE